MYYGCQNNNKNVSFWKCLIPLPPDPDVALYFRSYDEVKHWIYSQIPTKDYSTYKRRICTPPERLQKIVAKDRQYLEPQMFNFVNNL